MAITYLQYSDPVIAPVGESLSNPELFARLARAMGLDDPALSPSTDELLHAALDGAGTRLDDSARQDLRRTKLSALRFNGRHELIQFGTDFPTTASGKIELCIPRADIVRAAPTVELSPGPAQPGHRQDHQLHLRRVQFAGRATPHTSDRCRGARHRDGAVVRVYNDLGEVHVHACVNAAISARRGYPAQRLVALRNAERRNRYGTGSRHLTDIGAGACFNDARVEVAPL